MSDANPTPRQESAEITSQLSRRSFIARAGSIGVAAALGAGCSTQSRPQSITEGPMENKPTEGATPVHFRVNGKEMNMTVDPRTTLLDCLRESLQLTGTKKGCDHGQCGACTVHVNGRRINSCLTFAASLDGDEITTIEGLGSPENLHPMQAAFVQCDGYQCGYCTSGQIMSAVALLKEPVGPSDADVKEMMSGNICRCGAYINIVKAIQKVRNA